MSSVEPQLRLLFVGTGVSCAIPVIGHVGSNSQCCCEDAAANIHSPNRRNNVSLLFSLPAPLTSVQESEEKMRAPAASSPSDNEDTEHLDTEVRVLIDCGKTFRNAYLRVMAPRRIRYVDALLVTHGHADAMNCVEDLCDVHTATMAWASQAGKTLKPCVSLTPMYLTIPTLREVELVVSENTLTQVHADWMSSSSAATDHTDTTGCPQSSGGNPQRARLAPHLLPEDRVVPIPLDCLPADFPLYSLPVEHGKNYISLGFVFGRGTCFKSKGGYPSADHAAHSCIVYISDLTVIPDFTYAFLKDLMKIDVLVIDLLAEHGSSSPAHTCWDDLWPIFKRLHPKKVYCVGMFCSIEHHDGNRLWIEELKNERQAAEDGLATGKWSNDPDELAWQRHFLDTMESIEFAYDGLELLVPS